MDIFPEVDVGIAKSQNAKDEVEYVVSVPPRYFSIGDVSKILKLVQAYDLQLWIEQGGLYFR